MKNILLLVVAVLSLWATKVPAQQSLTASEKDLLSLLEEEKLANEVYAAMYDKWQHHSFRNIREAEERHLELMKQLATDSKLPIPASVEKEQRGVFNDPALQSLYKELLANGNQSLVFALKVGARIEETDIRDLKQAIGQTDNQQAVQVYTTLLRASENHLRAFHRNLDRLGENYAPLALSTTDYQSIIDGKNTCVENCCKNTVGTNPTDCPNGKGKGRQSGKCCAGR